MSVLRNYVEVFVFALAVEVVFRIGIKNETLSSYKKEISIC